MNILEKIEISFKKMVETGKVDLSITEDLNKFKDELIEAKNKLTNKIDVFRDFPIFYAIDTQIRIINHMIYRINLVPETHDNPKVADDSLLIIPQLKVLNDTLNSTIRSDSYYILDLSSSLQMLAMKNKMYPPPECISKSISKKDLENNFNRFVNNVGEEIERI